MSSELMPAVGAFLRALEAERRSRETVHWYRGHLHRFATELEGNWQDVEAVRVFLATRDMRPASVRAFHRCLRAFYRRSLAEGWCSVNPMLRIKAPPLPRDSPKALAPSDFTRLLLAAQSDARMLAVVLVLADTGMRANELCTMRRADVDLGAGTLFVRCGKGQQQRFVLVQPTTATALARWLDSHESPWVLPGRDGPMLPRSLHQLLTRFARSHGIEGRVNPHAFRHFLALSWVRAGGDVFSLADFLGHRDISTTRHYLYWSVDDLRTVHDRVSPVRALSK